jgi:hypothetical protein
LRYDEKEGVISFSAFSASIGIITAKTFSFTRAWTSAVTASFRTPSLIHHILWLLDCQRMKQKALRNLSGQGLGVRENGTHRMQQEKLHVPRNFPHAAGE